MTTCFLVHRARHTVEVMEDTAAAIRALGQDGPCPTLGSNRTGHASGEGRGLAVASARATHAAYLPTDPAPGEAIMRARRH